MVQAQAVALNAAPRPKSQCKRRQPAKNVLLRNAALRELKAKVRDLKSKGYTAPQMPRKKKARRGECRAGRRADCPKSIDAVSALASDGLEGFNRSS
jgi:hypothetical protein